MKRYKTIIFDLDHTLWDYEKNSLETLSDLHQEFELSSFGGLGLEGFVKTFKKVNEGLWNKYNQGQIDREYIKKYRFNTILSSHGIDNIDLSMALSSRYISDCPTKGHLMPYAFEVLDYLRERYPLYLLTNGFNDVQSIKISKSKIDHYFEGMVTSETCGHRKPSKEIFEFTLKKAGSQATEALMIGDNLKADIVGARNAAIDTVYFNTEKLAHKEEVSYEINCLSELTKIL
ncbi:YjjG family noncanonical pyrimidine nucleotidase [Fulvivirga lutea]|uniref:YjjG family noncanonical pyrimidine nucleotidase n=1 Tax=Fulvivirga lutea TaxID=2810512 RepID=A0A975A0N4_9BACT|nr:YjjG family noncanonical pyrimidine nucleotidase [Fulvivirga lutea]QSE97569.1 YjjG family noncanonical pyrimidine nucleotidase [Fulvivirga lutea]